MTDTESRALLAIAARQDAPSLKVVNIMTEKQARELAAVWDATRRASSKSPEPPEMIIKAVTFSLHDFIKSRGVNGVEEITAV